MRQGLLLAGVGAALGLVAAASLSRLMSSLLFGVKALDLFTYVVVSVLLMPRLFSRAIFRRDAPCRSIRSRRCAQSRRIVRVVILTAWVGDQ
jgi:hypothetical protein